jgi:hypothetical protein
LILVSLLLLHPPLPPPLPLPPLLLRRFVFAMYFSDTTSRPWRS